MLRVVLSRLPSSRLIQHSPIHRHRSIQQRPFATRVVRLQESGMGPENASSAPAEQHTAPSAGWYVMWCVRTWYKCSAWSTQQLELPSAAPKRFADEASKQHAAALAATIQHALLYAPPITHQHRHQHQVPVMEVAQDFGSRGCCGGARHAQHDHVCVVPGAGGPRFDRTVHELPAAVLFPPFLLPPVTLTTHHPPLL